MATARFGVSGYAELKDQAMDDQQVGTRDRSTEKSEVESFGGPKPVESGEDVTGGCK